MKLIDIIIFSISVVGLIYFFIDRRKYTSISTYHDKLERLNELRKTIAAIEHDINETKESIKPGSIDTNIIYDDELTKKLVKQNDNEEQLKLLKTELKEVEKYIQNARMYNKKLRV